jgi:hypothetical protein
MAHDVSGIRIAMWSGPRNISTALMRSWGSRPDTFVYDEPLYAHYLTHIDASRHPGHQETLAAHEADWRKVARYLVGPIPEGKSVFYQKHMAHHLLPNIETGWIDQLTNCFLIRRPRDMLASLWEKIDEPIVADTGLGQQSALYERMVARGESPIVIDADDVLDNPESMLRKLCHGLGVDFFPEMLSWAPGPQSADGAWGPFWYESVYNTTGFCRQESPPREIPNRLQPMLAECESIYNSLYASRLR